MNKTAQILKAARALISDERHWTRDVLARDSNGFFTRPDSPQATCWCAMGALTKAGDSPMGAAYEALGKGVRGCIGVSQFNDGATHAEVLALFDAAIAAEERAS